MVDDLPRCLADPYGVMPLRFCETDSDCSDELSCAEANADAISTLGDGHCMKPADYVGTCAWSQQTRASCPTGTTCTSTPAHCSTPPCSTAACREDRRNAGGGDAGATKDGDLDAGD